jgi:hypothetical protein
MTYKITSAAAAVLASTLALGSFAPVAMAQPTTVVVQSGRVIPAPPPPRHEVAPSPRRGQVWEEGHWDWRGGRHVWVAGHWVKARPGYAYRQPTWQERDGRWEMRRGGWDRDGDGVANRDDRRPNNPYRN